MCYENCKKHFSNAAEQRSVKTGELALQLNFKAVLIHAVHNAQMDRPGGNIDDVTSP